MGEPKPIASLTSGLLARKGGASPAMRRQVMLGGGYVTTSVPSQDDLGWNDMGDDTPYHANPLALAGLTPMADAAPPVVHIIEDTAQTDEVGEPAVVVERKALAAKIAAPAQPVAAPAVRKAKAAFTLRLDPERHLRLRLACAVGNRSAQQIVTEALDAFIESQPQIEALAEQLPHPRGAQN